MFHFCNCCGSPTDAGGEMNGRGLWVCAGGSIPTRSLRLQNMIVRGCCVSNQMPRLLTLFQTPSEISTLLCSFLKHGSRQVACFFREYIANPKFGRMVVDTSCLTNFFCPLLERECVPDPNNQSVVADYYRMRIFYVRYLCPPAIGNGILKFLF